MYIIDKNKDYYDYFSHIYGVDKGITFDRRGSLPIDDAMISDILGDSTFFILLEIGNVQHLIELYDFVLSTYPRDILHEKVISYNMKLVRTFREHKHHFDSPISIRGVNVGYHWGFGHPNVYHFDRPYGEAITRYSEKSINLPILGNTQITSLLDAQEIWIELQTYFSSLQNDKDVDLHMTDVEKAINHGFDKKTSFRNPIK